MRCFETPRGPAVRALEDAGYLGRGALHPGRTLPEGACAAVDDLSVFRDGGAREPLRVVRVEAAR